MMEYCGDLSSLGNSYEKKVKISEVLDLHNLRSIAEFQNVLQLKSYKGYKVKFKNNKSRII